MYDCIKYNCKAVTEAFNNFVEDKHKNGFKYQHISPNKGSNIFATTNSIPNDSSPLIWTPNLINKKSASTTLKSMFEEFLRYVPLLRYELWFCFHATHVLLVH